jgi:putative sigma-54 modulation protein
MNISVTFRHMEASEAIKKYASEKVAKLQKFLRQPMTAKVTLSLDKLRHVAETQVSSGGAHLEAKEASDDLYASIDKVIDKLERQIRAVKGTANSKKRRAGARLRTESAAGGYPAPAAGVARKKVAAKTGSRTRASSATTRSSKRS